MAFLSLQELAAAQNSNNLIDAMSVYIQRKINDDLQFAAGLSQFTTAAGLASGSIATRSITIPEVIDDCMSPQSTHSSEDETEPPATHGTRSPTSKSLTKSNT
ncbi:hypothetical protein Tco_0514679 [Tanacetum coccineum]